MCEHSIVVERTAVGVSYREFAITARQPWSEAAVLFWFQDITNYSTILVLQSKMFTSRHVIDPELPL